MAVTAFGLGTPISTLTAPGLSWGLSPYSGVSINPLMSIGAQFPPQAQLPLPSLTGLTPYASHPVVQQVLQLLQVVPQQLQQILQLGYLQQHQLQQLLQALQYIPAQLQQLTQSAPLFQQQPFGTSSPFTTPWGLSPQMAGAQPSHVM